MSQADFKTEDALDAFSSWQASFRAGRVRRIPRLCREVSIDHGTLSADCGNPDAGDPALLRAAYEEACAFLGRRPNRIQRAEMERSITLNASRGLRDQHRLAVKAVVAI